MIAPIITFRDILGNLLNSMPYVQTAPDGYVLPVNQAEDSNHIHFRIYNNYGLSTGVATAQNVSITVYDGAGAGSHTCTQSLVFQSWIRMFMRGYGENSVTSPDLHSFFLGTDTAIGGGITCGANVYLPEKGSNGGTFVPSIRAGTNANGAGFIEFDTYAELPQIVGNYSYNFAISMLYEWSP